MKRKKKHMKPMPQTCFQVLDGSSFKEMQPSAEDCSGKRCFLYYIDREEIEVCDTRRLLHDLRPDLDNPFFKAGLGKVVFGVSNYDEDSREFLEIPEFRAFVSKVQQNSPCWLYFAMPGNGWLRTVLAASATRFHSVVQDGQPLIEMPQDEVTGFMRAQLKECTRLCQMLGVDPDTFERHLHEAMADIFPGSLRRS
jgi:hypothetical protein